MELSFRPFVRRSRQGGVYLQFDVVAAGTIGEAVVQTRDLLLQGLEADAAPPEPLDPFEAIVAGLARDAEASQPPEDPVLRRLVPDAVNDDPEAAAEFRASTEHALRRRKAEAIQHVLDDLGRLQETRGPIHVPGERIRDWLTGINDTRLALGSMLQIEQDQDLLAEVDEYLDEVDDTAPGEDERTLRAYRILVYDMLTELQERILSVLR